MVQIMAWRRPGNKPLSEAMIVSLLTHICVTRPQWVKELDQHYRSCCLIYDETNVDDWTKIHSLWLNDTIWQHSSWSTLVQVMACCLMVPSHYLNQCWLIFSKVQWHSVEGNLTKDSSLINHYNKFENYLSKFLFKSPRGQWVNLTNEVPCYWLQGNFAGNAQIINHYFFLKSYIVFAVASPWAMSWCTVA